MTYLQATDVGTLPGRFQAVWNTLTPLQQGYWLGKIDTEIDAIVGMGNSGGLNAQTNRSYTIFNDRDRDTVFLPNKPITNIRSIIVQPIDGTAFSYPIVLNATGYPPVPNPLVAYPNTSAPTTYLWSGNGLRYVVPQNFNIPSLSFDRSGLPFREDDIITVTYDCGFQVIPEPVVQAAKELLGFLLFLEMDNPAGAADISEEGAHISFVSRGESVNTVQISVEAHLLPYRIEVMG